MKNKNIIIISVVIAFLFACISTFVITFSFLATHFYPNTKINGIDCSVTTLKQAQKKINQQTSSNEICIKLANQKEYKILGKDINLCLENKQELEKILKTKDLRQILHKKEYTLEQKSFSFDEEKLKSYLKNLPELKKEAIIAKDAYLTFDEKSHTVTIVPEKIGNIKNIDDAFNIAKNALQKGEMNIDFKIFPKITATDKELINTKEKMNQVLRTTIDYQLKNGKTVTLNWENWVKRDKQQKWDIEIENSLKEFVSTLSQKINQINNRCTFKATEIGNITLPLRSSLREQLNIEEETKRIRQMLGTGKTYRIEPIYKQSTYQEALSNYLEVDLTRQKVWLYRNGKCIVSGNCVSGSVSGGHSTPTGMYYLDDKTTNTYLRGRNNDGSKYNSHVNYWMPFNGGVGLHDATWRGRFGGTIYQYNGSHGCINLPYSVAKKIYENINYKTLIIIYKS